jgi:hypothetical protein
LALTFFSATPAFAATNVPESINLHSPSSTAATLSPYTIQKLTPYISTKSDGSLYIQKSANQVGVTATEYEQAQKSLLSSNLMIKKGFLTADHSGNISITPKYTQTVNANINKASIAQKNNLSLYTVKQSPLKSHCIIQNNTLTLRTAYSGVNKVVWTWYGCDLYLNNETASKVSSGINIAGTLSVLIPEPVVSKVLAIALSAAGNIIAFNNTNGRGVIIKILIAPPLYGSSLPTVSPIWISSQ